MKRILFAGVIVLSSGSLAAASWITADNYTIMPAANQTITVQVYGDGPETAAGLNMRVSVANGPGGSTDLVFTGMSFKVSGYMFDLATATEGGFTTGAGGTEANGSVANFAFPAAITIPGTETNRVGLVDIELDASSAPLGTWDFYLSNATLGDTFWSGGTAGDPSFSNDNSPAGTITVTPEPTVLLQLLGLAGMGGVGFWFRRRRKLAG